jgi:hypothetical protein
MKLIVLRLGKASKHHPFSRVSRRFESIVNLARIKPDNMTHVSHEGATSAHNS